MDVINFDKNKNNKPKQQKKLKPIEVLSLTNVGGSVLVYECLFMDNIYFRLRRAKDNAIVCDFDREFNMIGGIQAVVDSEALDKAIEIARERKECLDVAEQFIETGDWPEYYRGVKLPKKKVKLKLV